MNILDVLNEDQPNGIPATLYKWDNKTDPKGFKTYMIIVEDTDGVIYIGKMPKGIFKRLYKQSMYAPEEEDSGDFDMEGSGPYFCWVLEKESVEFFPTLWEAMQEVNTAYQPQERLPDKKKIALVEGYLGKPLYITETSDEFFDWLTA
jgi:hypothetical protein